SGENRSGKLGERATADTSYSGQFLLCAAVTSTAIRVGRWIACPDIETQYSLDNFMGTHSILFAVDTYTDTGVLLSQMLNKEWTVEAGIHSGHGHGAVVQGQLSDGHGRHPLGGMRQQRFRLRVGQCGQQRPVPPFPAVRRASWPRELQLRRGLVAAP